MFPDYLKIHLSLSRSDFHSFYAIYIVYAIPAINLIHHLYIAFSAQQLVYAICLFIIQFSQKNSVLNRVTPNRPPSNHPRVGL